MVVRMSCWALETRLTHVPRQRRRFSQKKVDHHQPARFLVGACRHQGWHEPEEWELEMAREADARLEMDKINIERAFRCCALGTRKRLVVFSVCSYLIQFNSIQLLIRYQDYILHYLSHPY